MDKKDLAFGKLNYIICAASVILIIIGFVLMTGPASSIEGGFEPDIFSTKRIVVAPNDLFRRIPADDRWHTISPKKRSKGKARAQLILQKYK